MGVYPCVFLKLFQQALLELSVPSLPLLSTEAVPGVQAPLTQAAARDQTTNPGYAYLHQILE